MNGTAEFVFIERIFPLYRKAVYDIIYNKRKFLFLHGKNEKSGIEQTQAHYSLAINSFSYGRKESRVFLFPFGKLRDTKPKVVIHEFSAGILSIPFILLYCRLSKVKLIFWGHMYERTKGFFPGKRLSDKYRLWLWRRADSLIACSKAEKEFLTNNLIPGEKIFVAPNTVDTNVLLSLRDDLESIGKCELKKRLKFTHEFNLVFIGRLYKEKKPDILLDLLKGLKNEGIASVAVHYIGDGEMKPLLASKVLEWGLEADVFFHGAVYDDARSGAILFCCDLMVMPGCVGLSVNHAFCFNCPVVTFREIRLEPAHGPEIEYIINGKTGFLIADHSTGTLVATVKEYLQSADTRLKMQTEIKEFIGKDCSIEKMAEGVIEAIDYSLQHDN